MSGDRRVLLVPSNGVGLGHLARQVAIARRLAEQGIGPVLCSLSPLLGPLQTVAETVEGMVVEHLPSYTATPLARWHWQRLLTDQLQHLTEVYGIRAVVFDGVAPYRGVLAAMDAPDAPPYVWVRRGRWRPDTRRPRQPSGFALVIEPGEVDRRASRPADRVAVEPVLLTDHRDLLDPAEARARLGLPAGRRLGLISLGTGASGALAPVEPQLVTALHSRGIVPVIARSPLLQEDQPDGPATDTHMVSHFPLAPALSAFHIVAVAAGYNSVAEVLACRVPALVIPNPEAITDDQADRARGVATAGLARAWDPSGTTPLAQALDPLLDTAERERIRQAMATRPVPEGASQAARAVIEVMARAQPPEDPTDPQGDDSASGAPGTVR